MDGFFLMIGLIFLAWFVNDGLITAANRISNVLRERNIP